VLISDFGLVGAIWSTVEDVDRVTKIALKQTETQTSRLSLKYPISTHFIPAFRQIRKEAEAPGSYA
jgi:hypothetical protein